MSDLVENADKRAGLPEGTRTLSGDAPGRLPRQPPSLKRHPGSPSLACNQTTTTQEPQQCQQRQQQQHQHQANTKAMTRKQRKPASAWKQWQLVSLMQIEASGSLGSRTELEQLGSRRLARLVLAASARNVSGVFEENLRGGGFSQTSELPRGRGKPRLLGICTHGLPHASTHTHPICWLDDA